jgi:hypothetical protein
MFLSKFKERGSILLPDFSGIRVMMLPIVHHDLATVPDYLDGWQDVLANLFSMSDEHEGKVVYLTIDEKVVKEGETHRRAGKHVDGFGGWGGGSGGWGGGGVKSTGMLTVSNIAGCKAWHQSFDGEPVGEGSCDHLADQCSPMAETLLAPNTVYWLDGMCVHESVVQPAETARQFVRLSLPSNADWYEGYTENPLGVLPTGAIKPRRVYMDS